MPTAATTYETDLSPKEAIEQIKRQRTQKLILVVVGLSLFVGLLIGGTALMYNDTGDTTTQPVEWTQAQ